MGGGAVGSVATGMLAVPLTLFAGGIGGFMWWAHDGTWHGILTKDHVLYMVGTDNAACWFSLIAHILFPQRTTQFAYTITLLGLILGACARGGASFSPPRQCVGGGRPRLRRRDIVLGVGRCALRPPRVCFCLPPCLLCIMVPRMRLLSASTTGSMHKLL
jgi:hypothetical protein